MAPALCLLQIAVLLVCLPSALSSLAVSCDVWVADAGKTSVFVLPDGSSTFTPVGTFTSAPGLFVTPGGDVFVADDGANAVFKLTNGVGPPVPLGSVGCGSGSLTPSNVFVAANGDVFFTCGMATTNSLRKFPSGTGSSVSVSGSFNKITLPVSGTANGDIYVGTGCSSTAGSGNVVKLVGGVGSPVTLPAPTGGYKCPSGLFAASNGDIYVTDYYLNKVLKIPGGSGTPVSLGGTWNSPGGVALHPLSGDVYVIEEGNSAVKVIPKGTGTPYSIGSGWTNPKDINIHCYTVSSSPSPTSSASLVSPVFCDAGTT